MPSTRCWPAGAHRDALRALLTLTLGVLTALSATAWEPERVARVVELRGDVSFYDPDRREWTEALRNRPVATGDRLVLGPDARAELRVDGAVLLLGNGADLEWLDLDAEQMRLRLREGTLALRIPGRHLAEQTEILTDEIRLRPQRGGEYRIDRDGSSTYAATYRGELEASGGGNLLFIGSGERQELWIDGRRNVSRSRATALPDDRFAAWAADTWRAVDRAARRHAGHDWPHDVPGIEDLHRHGHWDDHPQYGAVWIPAGVSSGWKPFRDGRWVWVRPWGWTWIDAAPWAFPTSHYGRWVHWRSRWVWWPGPRHVRPAFSPAVVAWVGGSNISFSVRIGDIPPPAWRPLAPYQPYVPIVVHRPYHPPHHHHVHPPHHGKPPHRRHLPPPSDPISVSPGTQTVTAPFTAGPPARTGRAPAPAVTYGTQGVPVGVKTAPPVRSAPRPVASPAPGAVFSAGPPAASRPAVKPTPRRAVAPEDKAPKPRRREDVH